MLKGVFCNEVLEVNERFPHRLLQIPFIKLLKGGIVVLPVLPQPVVLILKKGPSLERGRFLFHAAQVLHDVEKVVFENFSFLDPLSVMTVLVTLSVTKNTLDSFVGILLVEY